MAGTKRHIDQVLRDKLSKHQAPIGEADWDAFVAFQDAQKPRRKPILYWSAAIFVLGLLSSILLWNFFGSTDAKLNSNKSTPAPTQSEQGAPEVNNTTSAGQEIQTQEIQTNKPGSVPESTSETPTEEVSNGTGTQQQAGQSPKGEQFVQERPTANSGNEGSGMDGETSTEWPIVARFAPLNLSSISPRVLLIPTPKWGWFEQAYITAYTPKSDKDSSKKTLPLAKVRPPMTPCIAAGFVYGFGTPQLTVPQGEQGEVHKDYEAREKEAKAKTTAFRFFAQYEYRLKLGLEFGAGLQFSSVTQVRSYSFENRSIPFIGLDGKIISYIDVPNGQPVNPTVIESRQNIYSATVPLSVGYARNIGSNLRLGIRAQGNLGMNWSKSYLSLDPKTLTESGRAGNSNPFSASYGGGLYGEYFYLSKWSLRGSLDWTAQNNQYKAGNSYNLQNRFYEIRFSLVRYL